MSKFNNYAKKLNEIANATFTEYREKSDAVKSAESKCNAFPRRNGADPSYMAKSARAEADLAEARAQFEHCRRHLPLRYNKDKRKNPVFSRVSAFVVAYSIPFPTLIVNEKSVE